MPRIVWTAAITVTLLLLGAAGANAQATPSVFTNPNLSPAGFRRVLVLPFSADQSQAIRDPFAAQKAAILFTAALKKRGLVPIEFADLMKRIQEETGVDFSGPASDEKLRLFRAEFPKHIDAAVLGHVSAWGVFTREYDQVIPIPTYGYVSGYGGGASWRTTQYVQVRRSSDTSVVGATVALIRVAPEIEPTLAWQYTHVLSDAGGLFRRPPTPDSLAERFFAGLADAFPVKP